LKAQEQWQISIAPFEILPLEVLQSFPTQQKFILLDIGGIDPYDSSLIDFHLENNVPRLPHQLAFQI